MKIRKAIVTFLAVSLLVLMASFGWCTDWYVRPSGGSYGLEDGTSYENAWDGFSNIVWGTGGVVAGDTLWVCGTFIGTQLAVGASGTSGNVITIRGDYVGDAGIIMANDSGVPSKVVYAPDKDYLVFDGLDISEASDACLYIREAGNESDERYITVQNCTIHDTANTALEFTGGHVTIKNNTIYNCDNRAIFADGTNCVITGNIIYDCQRVGPGTNNYVIAIGDTNTLPNFEISNNTITIGTQSNNQIIAILFFGLSITASGTIENNTITLNNSSGVPIWIENNNITVVGNTIAGGEDCVFGCGFTLSYNVIKSPIDTNGYGYKYRSGNETKIINNVFLEQHIGVYAAGANDYIVENNIITGCDYGLYGTTSGTLTNDYNAYYNNTTNVHTATIGSHSITSDPKLVNTYYLEADSPCIGAGTVVSGIHDQTDPATDIDGVPVCFTPTIGAVEPRGKLYFDADASDTDENGTKAHPFNSISDFTWTGSNARSGAIIHLRRADNAYDALDISGLTDTGEIKVEVESGAELKGFTTNGDGYVTGAVSGSGRFGFGF